MPSEPPHLVPEQWPSLIESIDPGTILVVIARSMGPRLLSREQPEDVWQRTLLHAWRDRAQHEWHGPRAFRAWVLGIARNRVLELAAELDTHKRSVWPQPLASTDPGTDCGNGHELPADTWTPASVAWHKERAALIERSLTELPSEQAELVRLHLLEDRPMREIALQVGVPESTCWSRFRKGAEAYGKLLKRLLDQSSSSR